MSITKTLAEHQSGARRKYRNLVYVDRSNGR